MDNRKHYNSGRQTTGRDYYIDGNTVRKTETYPYRSDRQRRTPVANPARRKPAPSSRRPLAAPRYQRYASERERALAMRRRRANEEIAMRNREKTFKFDLKYTLFLCVVVIITLGCCVMYLMTQSAVTQKNLEVTNLTSELGLLTDTNTTTRERINDAIDLDYVREYAREQLGMVYPSASQIITYQSSEEDYVKQYQDIPQFNE